MYKYLLPEYFKKQLKRIAKKDPQVKKILIATLKKFKKENSIHIGKAVYKVRMKSSYGGKSGGYRLLIFAKEIEKVLIPICIYSKTEKDNITHEEMIEHLERTKAEIE